MKTTTTFLIACLLFFINNTQAQNQCCSGTTVTPELTPGLHGTLIPINQNTPSISLAVNASNDLPNVEYIITKRGTLASNGSGEVILGTDIDGVFMPMNESRYGISLAVGDTFDLTALGYDLPLMKHLMDSLLNAVVPGSGPCCDLFNVLSIVLNEPALAGFCDSVNNAGIYSGNDINELEDLLVVFDLFSSNQSSVASVITTFQTINSSGTFIPVACGGTATNNFLPYGIDKNKKYGYVIDNPLTVQQLSDVSLFMMYPNPTTNGNGDVRVYFTTTKQVDLNINMYDALGRKVHSQTLGNVSGDFNTQIPTANLAAGMYFVELTDGYNSQTHKLQVK